MEETITYDVNDDAFWDAVLEALEESEHQRAMTIRREYLSP